MKFKPLTMAIYVGSFVAALHLLWSIIVALGMGQIYLDWVLGLHFIKNPFILKPFDVITMATLLVYTFVVGFVLGWAGTICWNKMIKK